MSWIQLTQDWVKILRAKTSQKVEGVVIYSMTLCKIYWMFISYSKYNCFNKNLEKYKSVEFECQQWPLFSQRKKGLKWGKRNQGFFSLKGVPIYYKKRINLPISSQLGIDHFQYLYLNNLREKKVKGFPRTWFYMHVDGFTVGTMSF